MKAFLKEVWDFVYQIVLWFLLIFGFFLGLFLMGVASSFLIDIFMAGFRML